MRNIKTFRNKIVSADHRSSLKTENFTYNPFPHVAAARVNLSFTELLSKLEISNKILKTINNGRNKTELSPEACKEMVEKPINIKTLIMPLDETIVMIYANMEQVKHDITIENFNSEDDFSPIQLIKVGINKIHSIFFTEELPAIAIDNKVFLKSDELNDNKMLIVEKISDTKFKTMQHRTLKAPPGVCML